MQNLKQNDPFYKKLKESYSNLTKSEKKIAEYMIDNFPQATLLSSSELAKKAGVSSATIIRFSRSMGYSGYIEMKKDVRENLNIRLTPYDYLKQMRDSEKEQTWVDHANSTIHDINDFIHSFDVKTLNTIVDYIYKAKTIYVIGIGSDAVVANYLFIYFRKMGFNTVFLNNEGLGLFESLMNATNKDLVILPTHPRFLRDEKSISTFTNDKGIPFVTITESNITALNLGANININIEKNRNTFFNSYVLTMLFCEMLLLKVYERSPIEIEENLLSYIDHIDKYAKVFL